MLNTAIKERPYIVAESLAAIDKLTFLRNRLQSVGRILVVDDNERAAEITQRALRPSFAQVDRTSSALEACRLIVQAANTGSPYTAMVVDLLMPNMNGLQLLEKLGSRMPAPVLHTASTLAGTVLHLQSELSRQMVQIFVHHKTGGYYQALIEKIDRSVQMTEAFPQAVADFFREFKPRLHELQPGVEEAHNFCEEARNFASELRDLVRHLSTEHRLKESGWWRREGSRFEAALNYLAHSGVSTVLSTMPGLTDHRMHNIQNMMMFSLAAPTASDVPEFRESEDAQSLIQQWAESVSRYAKICNQLRNGFNKQFSTFDLPQYVASIVPETFGEFSCDTVEGISAAEVVPDPEGRVRSFLKELFALVDQRCRTVSDARPGGYALFVPEARRIGEESCERSCLQVISAGGYWAVNISADHIDLESEVASLAPALSLLRQHGEADFRVERSEERSYFKLFIKTSPKSLDLEAVEDGLCKDALTKKEDGSYTIPRSRNGWGLWVREGLGERGEIIVLAKEPQESAKGVRMDPLIYRYEDKIIFAGDIGHSINSEVIVEYIRHIRGQLGVPLGEWDSSRAAHSVYVSALRLHPTNEGGFVLCCPAKSAKASEATKVLEQLGISPEKILANPRAFLPLLD
jgi:CheY-like chemotaxis protein